MYKGNCGVFLFVSLNSLLRVTLKFNNMRFIKFQSISYFMEVKEFKMCLQTKDMHFHPRDYL
jgi:hypothetical protein